MTLKRVIASIMIVVGIGIISTVAYVNSIRTQQPIFSNNAMLSALWESYKVEYIEPSSGRTLDKQRNNLTTSEGESYTMLRSVWQDDRTTFDKSLKFTNDILKRKDNLFSWQFGKRADGSYGILTDQGGNNTASDADGDISLALIFASQRWQSQAYLDQAKQAVSSMWDQEVITVDGKYLLVANNLEKANTDAVIVNPSYFSPANYRIFAKIDNKHDWNKLADDSYSWLENIRTAPSLGNGVGLPPDWVSVRRDNGQILPPPTSNLTTQFGYDAMRLPFRLSLDVQWNNNQKAKDALAKLSFLKDRWAANKKLSAIYSHDGSVVGNYEAPSVYGGTLGYFKYSDTADYDAVYQAKLKTLYDPDKQAWRNKLSYYDDNWAWFGLALHEDALIDLSKN